MHNEDLINLSKARISHSKDCLKEAEILLSAGEIQRRCKQGILCNLSRYEGSNDIG